MREDSHSDTRVNKLEQMRGIAYAMDLMEALINQLEDELENDMEDSYATEEE